MTDFAPSYVSLTSTTRQRGFAQCGFHALTFSLSQSLAKCRKPYDESAFEGINKRAAYLAYLSYEKGGIREHHRKNSSKQFSSSRKSSLKVESRRSSRVNNSRKGRRASMKMLDTAKAARRASVARASPEPAAAAPEKKAKKQRFYQLKIRGEKLDAKGFFYSSPLLTVCHQLPDGSWGEAGRTNVLDNTLNPKWDTLVIESVWKSSSDIARFVCWDVHKTAPPGLIGEVDISMKKLKTAKNLRLTLLNPKKKKGKEKAGTIIIERIGSVSRNAAASHMERLSVKAIKERRSSVAGLLYDPAPAPPAGGEVEL
jgi:hypothetical protein